ncbi:hypothetical protein IT575_03565 [bacterium]|nr:hypothetical protein [bacterium]
MSAWRGWPFERFMYFFIGLALLLVWAQVSLFHGRTDFRDPLMWIPVVFVPLQIASAWLLTLWRGRFSRGLYIFSQYVGILGGLYGSYLHYQGVIEYAAGEGIPLGAQAFMGGPPVLLPFLFACVSLLGVVTYSWPWSSRRDQEITLHPWENRRTERAA